MTFSNSTFLDAYGVNLCTSQQYNTLSQAGNTAAARGVLEALFACAAGHATQASLSNPFGFADFFGGGDEVRVARPVAIAETVGGQSDQVAVLRLRQGGENSLQLTNTWRWEDTFGGGDRDYNDLVVQLDFTSAYGHRWLV